MQTQQHSFYLRLRGVDTQEHSEVPHLTHFTPDRGTTYPWTSPVRSDAKSAALQAPTTPLPGGWTWPLALDALGTLAYQLKHPSLASSIAASPKMRQLGRLGE